MDVIEIMDHTEAIVEFKNIIDLEFIKKITSFIEYKSKNYLSVETGLNKKVRNVKGYNLNISIPTDLFYWNFIKKEIERLYYLYNAKFPKLKISKFQQIDLLKYTPNGKYDVHVDYHYTNNRHLSIIINLNEKYEGGDLIFTDQKLKEIKRLKLGKGSAVIFPSNFMYPHGIEPVKKGIRYSIVAWMQ